MTETIIRSTCSCGKELSYREPTGDALKKTMGLSLDEAVRLHRFSCGGEITTTRIEQQSER